LSYILHIETATTVCSVAISHKQELIFTRELNAGFTHAENLHVFIEQGLNESGLKPSQLSAIAVSKGPGSYTGLRIGVSSAKGLAYALRVPLISLGTLQVMAAGALSREKDHAVYCPMIDARRMEVYTALYDHELKPIRDVEALIVDETSVQHFAAYPAVYFFGEGMPKCQALLSQLGNARFIESVYPSAKFMVDLAYRKFIHKDFENLPYFEPFYLKDFIAGKKKKQD
jgi:tRNA threonylcarbamoyladenosine biosynthesis protein TsaB